MSYAKMMKQASGKNKIRYQKTGCTYDIRLPASKTVPTVQIQTDTELTPLEKEISRIANVSLVWQSTHKPNPFWCQEIVFDNQIVYWRKHSPCSGTPPSASYFISQT